MKIKKFERKQEVIEASLDEFTKKVLIKHH